MGEAVFVRLEPGTGLCGESGAGQHGVLRVLLRGRGEGVRLRAGGVEVTDYALPLRRRRGEGGGGCLPLGGLDQRGLSAGAESKGVRHLPAGGEGEAGGERQESGRGFLYLHRQSPRGPALPGSMAERAAQTSADMLIAFTSMWKAIGTQMVPLFS